MLTGVMNDICLSFATFTWVFTSKTERIFALQQADCTEYIPLYCISHPPVTKVTDIFSAHHWLKVIFIYFPSSVYSFRSQQHYWAKGKTQQIDHFVMKICQVKAFFPPFTSRSNVRQSVCLVLLLCTQRVEWKYPWDFILLHAYNVTHNSAIQGHDVHSPTQSMFITSTEGKPFHPHHHFTNPTRSDLIICCAPRDQNESSQVPW